MSTEPPIVIANTPDGALSDLATLATWDAVETRDRVRIREVSAQEVAEAAIARAEKARHLGAVVEPMYERARSAARNGRQRGSPGGCAHVRQRPGPDSRRSHRLGLAGVGPLRFTQDRPVRQSLRGDRRRDAGQERHP
jgi:hypothetical protein